MSYATLAQGRAAQTSRPDEHTVTATDSYMINYLRDMTDRINHITPDNIGFEPVRQTRRFSPAGYEVDRQAGILFLDAPLLEVVTLTDSDGTVLTEWDGNSGTLSAADYRFGDLNQTPHVEIHRLDGGDNARWSLPSSQASQIEVDGYFGYRREYVTEGFLDSTDENAAAITSTTQSTFAVDDADGEDFYSSTPRFSVGQLIRIADEFMRITSITTNTLTVLRGVNGTTATTHLISQQIDTWHPDRNVVRICARGAAYMAFRAGRFDNATFDGLGTTSYPADLLKEVSNVLDGYPNLMIKGGLW